MEAKSFVNPLKFKGAQAVLPIGVKPDQFSELDTVPVCLCKSGQLFVPGDAQSQGVEVHVAFDYAGSFVPLCDEAGNPVSINVEPGRAYCLPAAIFESAFVRLVGEPGASFQGTLVLNGKSAEERRRAAELFKL